MMRLLLTTILSLVGSVEMYSKGAPPGVCGTMTPKHGVPVQTGPSPYTIALSKRTYEPNEEIQVTLSGSTTFKGFLIKPMKVPNVTLTGLNIPDITRSNDNSDLNSLFTDPMSSVGTIKSDSSTKNNCQQMESLTHTSNSTKQLVTFTWTAPDSDQGAVVFRYTVVQSKAVYWVNMTSEQITFAESASTHLTYSLLALVISLLSRFLQKSL